MSNDFYPCPDGVHFYKCHKSIKCCTIFQNGDDHCPSDQKQATWSATYSDGGRWDASSNSTTCENQAASHMGCCKIETSKCAFGCPQSNLSTSFVNFDLVVDAESQSVQSQTITATTLTLELAHTPKVLGGAVQQVSATQDSSSSSSIPTSVSTAIYESQSAPPRATSTPETNSAAIAGGVAGGIVGLALLVGILAICYRRQTSRVRHVDEGRSPSWALGHGHSIHPNDAALEQIKQGASPSKSHQHFR